MATTKTAPTSRLLVVDDEVSVQKLLKIMLVRAAYQVETCTTAAEALKTLKEGSFDCVITDAIMPGVTGYDLVKTIRQDSTLREMPVLMLTRKRHRQDVKLAVQAGVTDYILKPVDEHLLLDKVELCLKKGGGKRHIFEMPVHGEDSKATLQLESSITMLSESDITIRIPFMTRNDLDFDFKSHLFEEIGIALPLLKFIHCKEAPEIPGGRQLIYEAKFAFVGVPEADLQKIRMWIQKQELQRRK